MPEGAYGARVELEDVCVCVPEGAYGTRVELEDIADIADMCVCVPEVRAAPGWNWKTWLICVRVCQRVRAAPGWS